MSDIDVTCTIHAAPIGEGACNCPAINRLRDLHADTFNIVAASEYRRRWLHQHGIVQIRDAETAALRKQICRLVSGQAIESDSLCQHHDADVAALAEVARLRAELADTRTAMELAQSAADRRGAKIDSLAAELAAARAVPPDVEAAIVDWLPAVSKRCDGDIERANREADPLRTTIVRAISDAKAAAVFDFIDSHARRLVEQSGTSWDDLRERQGCWRGAIHEVLDRLVESDGWIYDGRDRSAAAAGRLREAPATRYPCPSCGIDHTKSSITKYPEIVTIRSGPHKGKIGAAIEWRRDGAPAWVRVIVGVDDHGFEIRENFDPCQLVVRAGGG